MQVRIICANGADIGLEMLDVNDIEADYGCVEADVCFCDFLAEVEWALRFGFFEVFLYPIQTLE
jgi:hypothetical protein